MSNIRILPDILSNKIAAGEVVERPASVVKELVENALDAACSRIMIEVVNGGRTLIRVSDDGTGMGRDDALLSVERYATSKIYADADLFTIRTLGFRGEALPSIAAVSRFTLVTCPKSSDAGTEIVIDGGRIKRVSDIGAPPGTMVTIKQLFFNTPARRKFLKTIPTEMSHVADTVAGIALGRPAVQFKLTHNQKTVQSWTAAPKPEDRVAAVLGKKIKKDLYPIELLDDTVTVSGWIASPGHTRSTSKGVFVFVNGRPVRDRVIQHALFEGFRPRLMKGQFPLAVLNIGVPFEKVDVNVHPTKHEVRFAEQKKVHEAVQTAVSEALRAGDRPGWTPVKTAELREVKPAGVGEPVWPFSRNKGRAGYQIGPGKSDRKTEAPITQAEIWKKKPFGELRVIGQFYGTYILCESTDELVLIDQHAAHERILFEQLQKQSNASPKASQKLLVPETIELGFRESEILTKLIPGLETLGLEIEPFGGNTFVIKAVPALIAGKAMAPLVVEMVEKTAAVGFGPDLKDVMQSCLVIMACHGTIRANQPLADPEIEHLLKQLDECENPSHCPHGRPTWITWTLRAIEKSFGRTV